MYSGGGSERTAAERVVGGDDRELVDGALLAIERRAREHAAHGVDPEEVPRGALERVADRPILAVVGVGGGDGADQRVGLVVLEEREVVERRGELRRAVVLVEQLRYYIV